MTDNATIDAIRSAERIYYVRVQTSPKTRPSAGSNPAAGHRTGPADVLDERFQKHTGSRT